MFRALKMYGMLPVCAAFTMLLACAEDPHAHLIQTGHLAAMHGVHNEHIASLMRTIERKYHRTRRYAGPRVSIVDRHLEEVAKEAAEIMRCADQLRGFPRKEKFPIEDRDVFLAHADVLRERAMGLRDAARSGDHVRAQRAYARLTATCNSCHFAFREPIQEHHEREHVGGGRKNPAS